MKQLSNNARKLLLAIGKGDKRDIVAHELCMRADEFIDASDELRRESLLDHWHLSEIGIVGDTGAKLQSPTLTTKGEKVFRGLRQN